MLSRRETIEMYALVGAGVAYAAYDMLIKEPVKSVAAFAVDKALSVMNIDYEEIDHHIDRTSREQYES